MDTLTRLADKLTLYPEIDVAFPPLTPRKESSTTSSPKPEARRISMLPLATVLFKTRLDDTVPEAHLNTPPAKSKTASANTPLPTPANSKLQAPELQVKFESWTTRLPLGETTRTGVSANASPSLAPVPRGMNPLSRLEFSKWTSPPSSWPTYIEAPRLP
ncbi:MAG: hypothetical protein GSR73_00400, partial [Desulfurococcales archaeon]|nr:hypothetical protein [Desulfurococcales archaeon]